MKVTSEQFKTKAENQYGTVYQIKALVDGIEITDEIQDFEYSSMTNPDGEFTFGNTCASQISFKIDTPSQNLTDREITIQQGIDIDGVVEYVNIGVFKVLKPENTRSVYTYQCVDRMVSRMEMPYFSELTYPATDIDILEEICNQVNISLDNANSLIPHTLQSAPSGYTRREIIGYMAQLQGKNAIINGNGNLELKWYNNVDYTIDDDRIYLDGSDSIKDETNYILGYIECSVSTSSDEEIKTIKSGAGNIGIKTENPFMTQEILDEVFSVIGGFSFMPVEVQFLGDFRLEVGDIVTVETYGKTYQVPIMQLTHSSDGGVVTTIESVAETDSENEISFTNPITKQMERYYAELVLINKALVNKLGVEELDAAKAEIEQAIIVSLDTQYAKIDFANIDTAKVDTNIVSLLLAEVGLIDRATIVEGHVTKLLDAVEINANSITSGTLTTDRLVIRGTNKSIVYELNNISGALQSVDVNTLNGEIITPRTINADKLIANSITANELDVTNIFGNTAVLKTIVSQDIFSDAVGTHTLVVGAYEYAEEAVNLSKPTSEAQGSPIYIDDSADGVLIDFKGYGRSEQKSYSGKNKLNNTATTKTVNGVTFTVNDDGSITANGTATGTADIYAYGDYSATNKVLPIDSGNFIASGTGNAGIKQYIIKNSSVFASSLTGQDITFSITDNINAVFYRVETGVSLSNFTFYPMIRLASITDDTYEPYVGATSSPNPDYPQDIDSIADSGWFDGELLQGYWDDTTGNYTSNNYRVCSKNKIQCKSGDVIEITTENKDVELWRVNYYKEDGTFISVDNNQISTAPTNASYFYITVGKRLMDGNVGFKISDAGHICVTINDTYAVKVKSVGKNKLNITATTVTRAGVTFTIDKTKGTVSCSGTASTVETEIARIEIERIDCKKYYGEKINLSGCPSGGSNVSYFGVYVITYNDGTANNWLNVDYGDSLTIDVKENMKELIYFITIAKGCTVNNITFKPQLEIGDKFTGFEPHKESSVYIPLKEPLRSSLDGSVKDEISCVDGVYGVTRRFAEVVFDKNTEWQYRNNCVISTLVNNTIANDSAISTHFKFANSSTSIFAGEQAFSIGSTGIAFYISGVTNSTKAWTEWIANNSFTVQYELANPVFEPFEDQTPFNNIVTYNSVTHISATDNPEMRVEYYRNNKNGEQFSNFVDVSKRTEEVATNASNNANNALNTANTANSTANTANTNANNAMSTANTANTNATNAYNRATYHYGTCSTAAATAAKVVTLNGFALYTGAQVTVQFAYGNTATNPTLNVNGTGAKNIRVNNANITSKYYWSDNNTVTFTYNGSYWIMSDSSANTILANWASSNDITYIDGGKIYTGSITADKIDVKDLFAQDITATGKISGAKLYGTYLESISGKIGGFTISGSALYNNTSSITSNENGIYVGTNGIRTVSDYGSVTHSGYYSKYEDRPTDDVGGQTIVTPSGVSIYEYTYNGMTSNCGVDIYKDDTICGSIDTDGIRNPSTLILGFDGSARLTSLNVSGTAYVGGATTLESTLDVKGNATIGSNASKIQIGKAGTGTNATSITFNNSLWINPYDNLVILKNNCGLYGVNTSGDYTILAAIDKSDRCLIGTQSDTVLIGKNPNCSIGLNGGLEIYTYTPFIDFHYNNTSTDRDVRLINDVSGQLAMEGTFVPKATNTYTNGDGNRRWKQLFANTSTISTSDRTLKKDFKEFDERYDSFYDLLKPYSFKFIDGESGRTHAGFISQDIEESLAQVGLTALDFAGFCKDVKKKEVITKKTEYDEDGNLVSQEISEWVNDLDEDGNLQYTYSLRYEEFIALNTNQIQKLKARVNTLEEENRELKETINNVLLRLQVLEERG